VIEPHIRLLPQRGARFSLCLQLPDCKRMLKGEPKTGRKSLQNTYLTKDCYPEYIRALKTKHQENRQPIKKWVEDLDTSPKMRYRWQISI